MTERQTIFCEEYLLDLNASRAARQAGYSQRTATEMGHENLRKPHIKKAIARRMAARRKRMRLAQDDVITHLMEVLHRCMDKEDFDATNAIRTLELLGRHLGMFSEKKPQPENPQLSFCWNDKEEKVS